MTHERRAVAPPRPEPDRPGHRELVLIVEDEPDFRELVELWVSRHGWRTATAADGLEVMRRFEEEAPDLVLLDLGLPGMDGLSVTEWMKQVDPGYQFRYDEGMRAVNARQSAGKDRLSGRALREAARYGQDYATGEFEKSINRLFKQAGLGDADIAGLVAAGALQV